MLEKVHCGALDEHRSEHNRRGVVGESDNGDRTEFFLTLVGTSMTTTYLSFCRTIQGPCSRPMVNPEFFWNVSEIPDGWTNVIYHSSSKQHLNKIMLNGLIAGRNRQTRRQTNMLLLSRTSTGEWARPDH